MDKTWIGSGRRRSNTLAGIASAAGDDPHGRSRAERTCRYWSERLKRESARRGLVQHVLAGESGG